MSDDFGKDVKLHSLKNDNFSRGLIYVRVNQIVDRNNPFCKINEVHSRTLAKSPRNFTSTNMPVV